MSGRTRDALLSVDELGEHHYGAHASHQVDEEDVEWRPSYSVPKPTTSKFVRRHFAAHANKAVSLHQFVRFAPLDNPFAEHSRRWLPWNPTRALTSKIRLVVTTRRTERAPGNFGS